MFNNAVFLHCITEIKNLGLRIINKVIIGTLNINSLPNKFDQLREIVLNYFDVLVITETKLDDILGYSGGIMVFIRNDIPSRVLTKHVFQMNLKVYLLG